MKPLPALDPRSWKREHRLALALAAGLGAVAGALLMRSATMRCLSPYENLYGEVSWFAFIGGCWFTISIWPAIGAAIGIALVYVRQLLRA